LFATNTETDSFSVTFTSATTQQIKDYAAKVKAAGFNINEEIEDQEVMGMVIYSFIAENADGYTATITFANGTSSLTISK
jgi:predicted lactoylglutathione lyase